VSRRTLSWLNLFLLPFQGLYRPLLNRETDRTWTAFPPSISTFLESSSSAHMNRYKIIHRTYYNFSGQAQLGPHTLRLRPREGHELRIESSNLRVSPSATLRWHRDVEDNSVATAHFSSPTNQLLFASEVVIQQFNQTPLDFLVADSAINYPFSYAPGERALLCPYLDETDSSAKGAFKEWISAFWRQGAPIQTYDLMQRLASHIHNSFAYKSREEPGVQSAGETLFLGSGSCRDFAALMIAAAKHLGLAARFVSGYLHAMPSAVDYGATHAWAEIYLPGAGWKGFDPTTGELVGTDHISVAVARLPQSVPPVEGSFLGLPGSNMDVGVWVTEL